LVISAWTALHGLLDLVFPLRCAGCADPGTPWCPECAQRFLMLRRLRRPLLAHGPPAYALGHYRGAARRAVLAYKESGRRDLARPFATLLATGLRAVVDTEGVCRPEWVVPAPSRALASRRRGGPHMRRIAVSMAAALSAAGWTVPVADCLMLAPGTRDSTGLTPDQRIRNLSGRLSARPRHLPPRQAPAVVIDDVLTTGTTARSCVRELDSRGVRVVAVLSLTATADPGMSCSPNR
jgi:predicted amidophosphoribosyltransferase